MHDAPFDPNRRYSSSHTLPDGTIVNVSYEYGCVTHCSATSYLPTGKIFVQSFDRKGVLTEEQHSYGRLLDFCMITRFENGKPFEEQYFGKNRFLTRARYEKARAAYPDMPPPTAGLTDVAKELDAAEAAERREHRARAKQHTPNAERASKLDAFCRDMLAKGQPKNAAEWIVDPGATLGERDRRASRALVASLLKQGATKVWACEIDVVDPGRFNTGHLVVELPIDTTHRKTLLRTLDRLAREQGYEGDMDDGQHFAYVKLD